MSLKLLKEMFSEMVEKKDAALIPHYYHPDFKLYANGQVQDYTYFREFHEDIYQTGIQYAVSYDDEVTVATDNKIAARVFIDIEKPGEQKKELEVILICEYRDNKIFRIWELCYPDWSKMPEFQQE